MTLRNALIVHIVIVAAACSVLSMGAVLYESRREFLADAAKTADLVATHLNFQLIRVNGGYDALSRFPDWDAILDHIPATGQCVSLLDAKGITKRGDCTGVAFSRSAPPSWFSVFYDKLFGGLATMERSLAYRGKDYGTLVVTSNGAFAVAQGWQDLRNIFGVTAFTILSLCVLVYVAVGRALAPAKQLVAGLNRLAEGDFSHRLPDFHLAELQRISEVSNQLAEKIESALAERGNLANKLMQVQEAERRQLARELHDEFAQNLTAISALGASLEKIVQKECPDLAHETKMLQRISENMMTALRGTLLQLRPADLETLGLTECLKQLVAVWNSTSRKKTCFELSVGEEIEPIAPNIAAQLYRIAQEALTNAAKHADAANVRLTVGRVLEERIDGAKGIRLVVEDDGKGRRGGEDRPALNGMGVLNMSERVAALGGTITFDDDAANGFSVQVRIPGAVMQERAL